MNRDQAISRIKTIEPVLRAMGAASLYLFGSTARNEAKPSFDVDMFIDLDPAVAKFSLVDLIGMEDRLTQVLGTKADVGTRSGLHPVLKDDIEKSAIKVF